MTWMLMYLCVLLSVVDGMAGGGLLVTCKVTT